MNLNSDGLQVGFLVGLYFLASAIVALTLVYFSRPRPKTQDTKNKAEPGVQNITAEKEIPAGSSENRIRIKKFKFLYKLKKSNPIAKPLNAPEKSTITKEDTSENTTEISEKVVSSNPEKLDQAKKITKEDNLKENPPLITITNAPKLKIEPVPSVSQVSQVHDPIQVNSIPPAAPVPGLNIEKPVKGTETKEVKPMDNIVTPLKQTVIVSTEKSVKEEKTQSMNMNSDFAELFTEDEEENETTRLAKELSEIDTEDIMQTSHELIDQLKRNNV